jgi:hypothetical protein
MTYLLQAILSAMYPTRIYINILFPSFFSFTGLFQNSSCKAQINKHLKKEKEKTLKYLKPMRNITCLENPM